MYKSIALQVFLIDNYDSFTYNVVHLLEKCGVSKVRVCKNDKLDFEEIETFAYLVISPGPKVPQQSGQLMACLQRFTVTKKILGICLGHQAIAEHFGAQLIQLKHPQHGASSVLEHTTSNLYKNIVAPITVGQYHSWAVDAKTIPNCLQVTAKNEAGIIMSVQHKSLPIVGLQYHPESYLCNRGEEIVHAFLNNY